MRAEYLPAIAVLVASLVVSCSTQPRDTAPATPSASAVETTPAILRERRRATIFEYRDAAKGDPFHLMRLATREGAENLMEAVQDQGPSAEAALRALPFAEDSEVALGRLANLAQTPGSWPARRSVLEALRDIALTPPDQREVLDAAGSRHAAEVLLDLSSDPALPRAERGLALSTLWGLSRRGVIDSARIPGGMK